MKNSKVKLVSLDPDLGSSNLKVWADACEQANKIVLLQTPISQDIVQRQISPQWQLWCMINWCVSATLLLMLMPTMAVLGVLIKLSSPGSVFHSHWSVGQRGKLFKLIQFRTTNSKNSNSYPFGQWLRQSGLDKLPQLINVLRGEMNLFGTHPYSLDEAASLDQKQRYQLRALPGVIGYWGTVNHSKAMDITPIV
ncbi:sugar transferase [Oscillatoria sp. FACHB-1407]|nr:heterocyst development glycosyltransferase HepC [Oscillatoria sp. FACHB-1407]MBD2459698.1 sugar transferase [Oscillatoria sp. FACHB-1407]